MTLLYLDAESQSRQTTHTYTEADHLPYLPPNHIYIKKQQSQQQYVLFSVAVWITKLILFNIAVVRETWAAAVATYGAAEVVHRRAVHDETNVGVRTFIGIKFFWISADTEQIYLLNPCFLFTHQRQGQ